VTGDYDLWMVAPHMSWWKLHMHSLGVRDEHGSSCATLLDTWLPGKLNEACGRQDNPVFNHGAEAQHYGFTQAAGGAEGGFLLKAIPSTGACERA
jgi:hypothetical protein